MSKAYIDESSLTSIGDAIRSKLNVETTYLPRDMATAIDSIETNVAEVFECYVVGQTEYAQGWLSLEDGGTAITPEASKLYVIVDGTHENEIYRWDGTAYVMVSSVPIATTLAAGKVKPDGTTITVSQDGTITASGGGGGGYVLPAATTSQLGGVKVDGTTITADNDGTIHGTEQIEYGYLYQGAFYEDSQHTTVITGNTSKLYIDYTGNSVYTYDGTSYNSVSSQITFATQSEAEAGTDNTKAMTPLRVAQEIAVKSPSANYTLLANRPAMVQGVGTDATRENGASAASGNYSHAEGRFTIASGECSHAEGSRNTASGHASHAEGNTTVAIGQRSHSEGYGTVAVSSNDCPQHVEGIFNAIDTASGQSDGTPLARYAHIIGNGTGTQSRSNLYAVRWDGVIEVNNVDMVDNVTIKRKTGTKQLYVDFSEVEAYIASVASRFRSTLESVAQQLESQGIDIDIGGGADVVGEYLVIDGLEIGQDGYIAVDAPISDGYLEF